MIRILVLFNYFVAGLGLIISLPLAFVAFFVFDAPGSSQKLENWLLFFSLVSFPIVIIVSFIVSFYFYKNDSKQFALMLSFLPYLSALFIWFAMSRLY